MSKTFNIYCDESCHIENDHKKYVIVLEPLRKKEEYYLLSAYYVRGKDAKRKKFEKKYKRKLPELLQSKKR